MSQSATEKLCGRMVQAALFAHPPDLDAAAFYAAHAAVALEWEAAIGRLPATFKGIGLPGVEGWRDWITAELELLRTEDPSSRDRRRAA